MLANATMRRPTNGGRKGGLRATDMSRSVTHQTSTIQLKVSPLKHVLYCNLQARKHALVGALGFQIALAKKSSCVNLLYISLQ